MLESVYRRSLEVADEIGAASVAFPAISTGAYGWPMDDAARIAVVAGFAHREPRQADPLRPAIPDAVGHLHSSSQARVNGHDRSRLG